MLELAACVSQAADLVDHALVDHHKQVAVIAAGVAREMGVSTLTRDQVVLAALMHDIGALSVEERLETIRFDFRGGFAHSEPGYLLLRQFVPFEPIARIVRVHHARWLDGAGVEYLGEPVPLESHIVHLADRVAVLVDLSRPVLEQRDGIVARIVEHAGSIFMPEAVEAFVRLSRDEALWLDAVNTQGGALIADRTDSQDGEPLDWGTLDEFAAMVSRIVDFRSSFTATHTAGVASVVAALGTLLGMSTEAVSRLRTAGNLHDVGKLAVPTSILEKPGPLDAHEWAVMKSHTYYTRKVLTAGGALSEIAESAAFHHERIDGGGYPFHVEGAGLDEGARLMAVADIFTAVCEDRPYRAGMSRDSAVSVLRDGAAGGAIDPRVVEALVDDFVDVNAARMEAQDERRREFVEFRRALDERAAAVEAVGPRSSASRRRSVSAA
jgi:HD-GYP domain-containing protein (c-di-GMP phosphodiesterase class II)